MTSTPVHARGFASDNYSGIHPEVLAAIAAANVDHEPAYGADSVTERLHGVFAGHFGKPVEVFPVFNGTGANVTALQSMLPRWGAVIAAWSLRPVMWRAGLASVLPCPHGRPEKLVLN